jgi:hypothetical protein
VKPLRKVKNILVAAFVLCLASTPTIKAQFLTSPQPGDVYKEFSRVMSPSLGETWRVNDPNVNLTTYPAAAAFLPNPTLTLTVDDLAGATRAEAVITLWGGHISTTGKKLRFNGNAWLNIPEMGTGNGIPSGSQGYNYLQQLNVTVPVPLGYLVTGTNTFEGTNSGQVPGPTGYGFGWGQHGWYAIMIRVYYDGTKAHPSGSVASPTIGSSFGENPIVSASVSAGVNRVDFLAYYDGFDTDGDGVYQDYHYDYHIGLTETAMNIKNHVGTATSAPWQVTWNTQWVPDQATGSVKLLARIRDNNGVWFVTPVADNLTFQRIGSSVKFYKPANTPERAWARGDLPPVVITTAIPAGDNIATATAAAVHVRTWNGLDAAREPGETHYRRYNGFEDTDFGGDHYYSYDVRPMPVSSLIQGTNTFSFYSQTVAHHGIEILWPGPGLMVRYTSASNVPPSITQQPSNQTTTVGQTATFTVGATGSLPLSYQWQKNAVNIGGASSPSYTTPATVLGDNGSTYRCVVTNSVNSATSNNATLTVNSALPSSIVSDDFNSAALNTSLWTFTNPVGDVTLTMTGTGTPDARVSLAIPPGVSHDLWTGANNAPRIMQSFNNSDFEVEAKFETPLTSQYQMQGILVQQDNTTFVRFDFVRDASSTRFFSASFAGGTPTIRKDTVIAPGNPLFLRVKRQGSTLTGSFSYNGSAWITATSFSYALTVNSVGPFVGNHGIPANTSPAFTALIDYFFNTASPISPEDGASTPVAPAITGQPTNQTVNVGQTATFSVIASGTAPLTYQWQKNTVNVGGATSPSYTTPATALGDNGSTYRCIVTNSVNSATSNSATLTVNSAPPPSGLVSDDFSAPALNTSLWTFVNPLGDAAASMTGTGTQDARLSIAIPAGVSHDIWTGANNAPRVLQAFTNGDFEAEVKFEAPLTSQYQMEGILAQQDNTTFVRFDFVRDASSTRFFSASFAGGTPTIRKDTVIAPGNPLFLRVKRQGNAWTGSFSTNGSLWITAVSFSYALTVNAVGPFVGNHGVPASSSPAFAGLIDYFFNTASPISPEDPTGTPVAPSIAQQPANQTVIVGQTATFTVAASGTTPLTYQWQKNTVNVGGATSPSYTTPATVLGDNGSTYRCIVINIVSSVTSNSATLTVNSAPPPSPGWWNTSWRYRVPVNVDPAGFQRSARPVDVTLNFTQLFATLGASGSFNENSLRVIEVTSTGSLIDSTIAFQFDKDPAYNAASNASGTLVFMLKGPTATGTLRYFHVYFETATGFTASSFANLVTVTDNVVDEGQSSFLVTTQSASYYYHKQGAGFSSILDSGGQDWLNYHVGGGSAGEYRGIPNMGVWAHPGYTNSSSSLSSSGPLKATVASQTTDGVWKLIWEFYPMFARMTLKQAGGPYWMLYEGTPNSTYNPTTGFWVRSSGQRLTDDGFFVGDIPSPEWVYFGDRSISRFLFLAHHEDDNLEDQYWNMENNMTVFGFGRQYATTTPLMTTAPAHLTIGFGEDTLQAVTTINSAYRDLAVTPGTPEINGGSPPPPPAGIISDNFNAGSLNTSLWSFINPLGDATVSMSGTQARISIPAGSSHDVWTGINNAPRLMQAAPNTDFEVEAKFDAAMTSEYQFQGIMAAENIQNFVRFDFVRDVAQTRFFAASFVGGTPTVRKDTAITSGSPLYLRVKRAGATWTGSFSYNGTIWFTGATFSQALTLSSAGPFAGNAGSAPPAFVALVDYFFNTASPQLPASAVAGTKTGEDQHALPSSFLLDQNYPNPFNPSTTIRYALPHTSAVQLTVYNTLGQEVAVLQNGEQEAGYHEVRFEGSGLSSGVYFYRIQAGGFVQTRRLLLLK